ncbi:MAG: MFS transporter [Candidatus Goldiibacteriota bacterium]
MKKRTIAAGFFIMLCLGSVYSWSVFRKPLEEALGIGAFESGFPFMVLLAMYSVSMLFSGRIIGRYRHSTLVLIGALLVGAGWMFSGFFSNIWLITFFYGVLTGAGIGLVYGIPLAAIIERFEKNRGAAMGLVLAGFGISAIITAPLLNYLIQQYGLAFTFKTAGTAFFFIVALLGFVFKNKHALESGAPGESGKPLLSFRGIMTVPGFLPLWLKYYLGVLAGLTAIAITSPVAQETAGLSAKNAGYAVGIFAFFNGIGRPVFGIVIDKMGFNRAAALNYIIIIAASLLVFAVDAEREAFFYFAFALLWFSMGGWLAMAPAATAALFGDGNYQKAYGVIFTAYGAAAITGIFLSGAIRDLTGNYNYMFVFIIAASAAGLLTGAFKRR